MTNTGYSDRVTRLFEKISDSIDVVVLSPSKTMRYFTGLEMRKSERPTLVVLSQNQNSAVVHPKLEADRINEVLPNAETYAYSDSIDPVGAGRDAFEEFQASRRINGPIGVEFRSTRLLEREVFAGDDSTVVDIENGITMLRGKKDSNEIERMRTAVTIIENILNEVLEIIEPGISERDIEIEIKERVMRSNADEYGIGVITSGERTAQPHTNTGSRVIKQDELVMIDAGVVYEGYYSDITRTVAVGTPDQELVEIYDVVQQAASAARERVEPGVEFQEIDRTARKIIEEAGYGEYFPHRVGHGVGLEGHEPPYLVDGNDGTLEVGHAITVEPGVYVSGLGGIRIEDDVVVTDGGADVLSTSSRELMFL